MDEQQKISRRREQLKEAQAAWREKQRYEKQTAARTASEVAGELEKLVESMGRVKASAKPELAQLIAEWQTGLRNQITRLA